MPDFSAFSAIWAVMTADDRLLLACLLTLAFALFVILLDGKREKPVSVDGKEIMKLSRKAVANLAAVARHLNDMSAKMANPPCGLEAFTTASINGGLQDFANTKSQDKVVSGIEAGLKAMGAQSIEEPPKRKKRPATKKQRGK